MTNNYPVSIAPMLDWTDKHCRYFHRLLSKRVHLYTEMITTQAILKGDREKLLNFHPSEKPLILQIGGANATDIALCARIGVDFGYDAININVGCPSARVQSGMFGACLMKTPNVVAESVLAICQAVKIPVSVKCRIGVDEYEGYENLHYFIDTVSNTGCNNFIIHARKAWLSGLSPKENRTIPPLCYDLVYQIKKDFPHLTIIINGGISNVSMITEHLEKVDGVMLGRSAYRNPYFLSEIEKKIQSNDTLANRETILTNFLKYIDFRQKEGVGIKQMTKHIFGLYHGEIGAKEFRSLLNSKTLTSAMLKSWLIQQRKKLS